jgi:ribonuclease J
MIGYIYKRGANIIEEKRRLIHVSGHASQEDIKIMTEATRPKFVVPIHGEYRMLFRHKEFVKNHLGYRDENVILIENGDVLELDGERATVTDRHEIGRIFIDDTGFEEIEEEVVRQRKQLAGDGILTPVLTLNAETGELETPPELIARGVVGFEVGNGLLSAAKEVVTAAVEAATDAELDDLSLLKERVRLALKRFVQKRTGGRPLITTVVVEV